MCSILIDCSNLIMGCCYSFFCKEDSTSQVIHFNLPKKKDLYLFFACRMGNLTKGHIFWLIQYQIQVIFKESIVKIF